MRQSGKYLFLIIFAMGLNRACSLIPAYYYFDPFPLYDILNQDGVNVGISYQSYIYMVAEHAMLIAIWTFMVEKKDELSVLFSKLRVVEWFSLFDFLVIYEHPWFNIPYINYGFEFTDIKLITYTYFIIRWNHGKL